MHCADEAGVVDVVSRGLGEWPVLSPAGHPGIDQSGVAGVTLLRSDAEALGHPGTHSLDEDVRGRGEAQDGLHAGRVLEVGFDGRPAPVQRRCGGGVEACTAGAVDTDHVRAHLGEQQTGIRARPYAGKLHHPHARQRAGRHSAPDPERMPVTVARRRGSASGELRRCGVWAMLLTIMRAACTSIRAAVTPSSGRTACNNETHSVM